MESKRHPVVITAADLPGFGATSAVAAMLKSMDHTAQLRSLFPSTAALAAAPIHQATHRLAEQMGASFNHLNQAASIINQTTIADSFVKTFGAQHAALMAQLQPQKDFAASLGVATQMQKAFAALPSSFASNLVAATTVQHLIESASVLRGSLTDEEVEELDDLAEELFDSHPDLADAIEDELDLYVPTALDKKLAVWFVRILVTMSVTWFILDITDQFPEFETLFNALGVGGGYQAGKLAGKATEKALDKLPTAEQE